MHQQGGFVLDIVGAIVPLVDLFTLAGRGGGRDFFRLVKQTLGEVFDGIPFQRGGKQHCLVTPAGFSGDTLDILREAHIQHAVRFIKDQRFDRPTVKVFFFDVLQQTARGCDHDILVLAEYFSVVHVGHAAGNRGDIQMGMRRQLPCLLRDLHSEFTGRR